MVDVLWESSEHTLAKLEILKRYLQAWMPILARMAHRKGGRPLYIDAFSGPGEYKRGEAGSPLVALCAAVEHKSAFPVPVEMVFVEKDRRRVEHLKDLLSRTFTSRPRNVILREPIHGEAEIEVRRILKGREPDLYTPTLVFLDQFGYSAVSMDLIRFILEEQSCEVFSFMNWQRLNPYLADPGKAEAIGRAFGTDDWRDVLQTKPGEERQEVFLGLYERALRTRGRAQFSWTFAMHGMGGELLYWLMFCSNSDRGLEEMKKAMWSVDPTGQFRFSDKYAGQRRIFQDYDVEWLADTVFEKFAGLEPSVQDVRHFVLTETPCHAYSEALARLEADSRISDVVGPPQRRKGTFRKLAESAEYRVRFRASSAPKNVQLGLF